jgi:hypothetical protein
MLGIQSQPIKFIPGGMIASKHMTARINDALLQLNILSPLSSHTVAESEASTQKLLLLIREVLSFRDSLADGPNNGSSSRQAGKILESEKSIDASTCTHILQCITTNLSNLIESHRHATGESIFSSELKAILFDEKLRLPDLLSFLLSLISQHAQGTDQEINAVFACLKFGCDILPDCPEPEKYKEVVGDALDILCYLAAVVSRRKQVAMMFLFFICYPFRVHCLHFLLTIYIYVTRSSICILLINF